MDVLKQKGKDCKLSKAWLRDGHWSDRRWSPKGVVHIKEQDYGKRFGGLVPITNKYVKKLKQGLKAEYRAVKRGEKQKLRKEIESEIYGI